MSRVRKVLGFFKNALLLRKEYFPFFKKKFSRFGKNAVVAHPSNIPNPEFVRIGENTVILGNSRIQVYNGLTGLCANVTIGTNCYIGAGLSVLAGANVSIGDSVLIASDVFIGSENHGMNPESETPYMDQPLVCKPVVISDGCWIGEKACVLPGVSIGKKCVIGAGSVVTKDVPDFSIAAGNPAKVMKRWNFEAHAWEKV